MTATDSPQVIRHSRRCMILTRPGHDTTSIIAQLTNPASIFDSNTSPTTDCKRVDNGDDHQSIPLSNSYYTAQIPIWQDEITNLAEWESNFLSDEAREVVRAVGAWIYYFPWPSRMSETGHQNDTSLAHPTTETDHTTDDVPDSDTQAALEAIDRVIMHVCGDDWDGVKLALTSVPESTSTSDTTTHDTQPAHFAEAEDYCMGFGFELVDLAAVGKNEFGEIQGFGRVLEALEANGWAAAAAGRVSTRMETDGTDSTNAVGDEFGDFGDFDEPDEAARVTEFDVLAMADAADSLLHGSEGGHGDNGDARQVEELERLVVKAMAIREQGSHLPIEQRKTFASEAIKELMRDSTSI